MLAVCGMLISLIIHQRCVIFDHQIVWPKGLPELLTLCLPPARTPEKVLMPGPNPSLPLQNLAAVH